MYWELEWCALRIGMALQCVSQARLNYISQNFLYCIFLLEWASREIGGGGVQIWKPEGKLHLFCSSHTYYGSANLSHWCEAWVRPIVALLSWSSLAFLTSCVCLALWYRLWFLQVILTSKDRGNQDTTCISTCLCRFLAHVREFKPVHDLPSLTSSLCGLQFPAQTRKKWYLTETT